MLITASSYAALLHPSSFRSYVRSTRNWSLENGTGGSKGCLATSWVLATSRGPRAGLRVVAHDPWRAVSESRCVPFCVQPDNDSLQPMDHTAPELHRCSYPHCGQPMWTTIAQALRRPVPVQSGFTWATCRLQWDCNCPATSSGAAQRNLRQLATGVDCGDEGPSIEACGRSV